MRLVLRLALAADAAALMTVVLGSWTRINGAGLTCPDWPLCRGQLIPSMTGGTLWEWTHRLLASAVAPLVVALVVVAWRNRKGAPFVTPTLGVIAGLFCVQVILGAETVRLANVPISVVFHWATAMALIAALSAMAVFANAPPRDSEREEVRAAASVPLALAVTATVAFVTMCVGAYVSSSGAGLACLSIPGCAGNVVVYTAGQYVQMLHRVAAGITLLCAATVFALVWVRAVSARVRFAATAGVVLVCMQIVLGLLNVALRLPDQLREAHAVNAALLFLAFFVATVFAALDAYAPAQARGLTSGAR